MRNGVSFQKIVQGGVGKDDPEAEGVVRSVALDDGDLVPGIGPLHQNREVQASRTAADRDDLHACDCTEGRTVDGPVTAYAGGRRPHEDTTLPAEPGLGRRSHARPRGDPADWRHRRRRTGSGSTGPEHPGTVPPNDNYRANYFVDYHVNPGSTGTVTGTQGTAGTLNDDRGQSLYRDQQRDPIDWRSDDASRGMYDPFARELQRFRGEMGTRYR